MRFPGGAGPNHGKISKNFRLNRFKLPQLALSKSLLFCAGARNQRSQWNQWRMVYTRSPFTRSFPFPTVHEKTIHIENWTAPRELANNQITRFKNRLYTQNYRCQNRKEYKGKTNWTLRVCRKYI